MEGRAIWNVEQSPTTTAAASSVYCTPFTLPSGGVITLDSTSFLTLAADAVFRPQCTDVVDAPLTDGTSSNDLRDPFYTSEFPQCYALAATTVTAYMLVIMLFITPRTFLSDGILVLGRRSFTNGPSGSDACIGIGGRPWLQKVAALTVAISLTIASVNTFRVAWSQYEAGVMNAATMQNQVLESSELKIISIISDTFLWLAQAQTLIRLFPRQREKIIIKWTAFCLISLDLLFSLLNTFVFPSASTTKPYSISEAIPAISYLFHLALGLLYGAWVLYYGFTKRNYAFYHPHMRNICLVALMAIISVIVPVVFFVLDISKPNVAGWGDYVRWVGAAAASVGVWEWVERIESLERNDRKDGVLGREVFDGDEMLEVTPSLDINLSGRRPRNGGDRGSGASSTGAAGSAWPAVTGIANRYRPRASQRNDRSESQGHRNDRREFGQHGNQQLPRWPARPPPAATPISRAETGSAESTVYAVRYHPIGESKEAVHGNPHPQESSGRGSIDIEAQHDLPSSDSIGSEKENGSENIITTKPEPERQQAKVWKTFQGMNPFRRKDQEPPLSVSPHTKKPRKTSSNDTSSSSWDILGRIEDFAAIQAERLRDRARPTHEPAALPITRIPAPPRRRTLREIMEELDDTEEPQVLHRPLPNVADATIPSGSAANGGGTDPSPIPRDSPTPGDSDGTGVKRRGSVSFAASVQRDRVAEAAESLDPLDAQHAAHSLQSNQSQPSGLSPSQNPELLRLPVMRISAPPRRPRSEGL